MAKRTSRFTPSIEKLERRNLLAAFTVMTTSDSGPGSLRSAIEAANSTPGNDTIAFQLPADSGAIRPTSLLPAILDPVIIDGTTQPG